MYKFFLVMLSALTILCYMALYSESDIIIDGVKNPHQVNDNETNNFAFRPTVNGTNVMLHGEQGPFYKLTLAQIAATNRLDFQVTGLAENLITLIKGCVCVANTNNQPFSDTATLTFYSHSNRHGSNAIWRADISLVCVLTDGVTASGQDEADLDDASDFVVNNMIHFFTDTFDEPIRIAEIAGNTVTFEDNFGNELPDNSGAAMVAEFGGFTLYDGTGSSSVWGRVEFSAPQTVDFYVRLMYRR